MRSRRRSFELDVPPMHPGVVQSGGPQDSDPSTLVERLHAPQLARRTEESGHHALLLAQLLDLEIQLVQPTLQDLRRGALCSGGSGAPRRRVLPTTGRSARRRTRSSSGSSPGAATPSRARRADDAGQSGRGARRPSRTSTRSCRSSPTASLLRRIARWRRRSCIRIQRGARARSGARERVDER